MRIVGFLNNEDEETIKDFVKDLIKDKTLEKGQLIESGGLGVRYEATYDNGEKVFEVHRLIATITVTKKQASLLEHNDKESGKE